jgi:hypothetical protein
MILELSVLGGAAALLFTAIRLRREMVLLAAVMGYAAATSWLLLRDLGFVLPALGIAIVLGLFGVIQLFRGEPVTQENTTRHRSLKIDTSRPIEAESIGP